MRRSSTDKDLGTAYSAFIGSGEDVVDATDPRKSNLARYINHPPVGTTANCVLLASESRAYVRATRDIAAGEELFLDYGYEYWNYSSDRRDALRDHSKARVLRSAFRKRKFISKH